MNASEASEMLEGHREFLRNRLDEYESCGRRTIFDNFYDYVWCEGRISGLTSGINLLEEMRDDGELRDFARCIWGLLVMNEPEVVWKGLTEQAEKLGVM